MYCCTSHGGVGSTKRELEGHISNRYRRVVMAIVMRRKKSSKTAQRKERVVTMKLRSVSNQSKLLMPQAHPEVTQQGKQKFAVEVDTSIKNPTQE